MQFSHRSVSDLLCRCIYFVRSAAHLLFRRIQKIEESFLPQSVSNNHTKVSLFRRVPGVAATRRLLHSTRIGAALVGLLFNVGILSLADDLCVACRLLLGGGEIDYRSGFFQVI